MHKSLVVKARVEDLEATENAIFDLTDSLGTCFEQEDVYFNVPRGHLKLRVMHPNVSFVVDIKVAECLPRASFIVYRQPVFQRRSLIRETFQRCGQLIFNSCSKMSGHKYSEAQVTEVEDVYNIRATLGAALGELGTIRKKRRIFITDDVRIYLDDVDEIGQFIDVAVSSSPVYK